MFTGTARYELVTKLGEGGMGVVYEAYDRVRGMRLALKTLRHVNAKSLYRFKREFRALCNLSHPNIINLYELASEGEHWFLTMELVNGVDMISYVRAGRTVEVPAPEVAARGSGSEDATADTRVSDEQSGAADSEAPATGGAGLPTPMPTRLDIDEVVDVDRLRSVLRQLADALQTLHAAHLVHRDLKPPNLLVTADGRLVLMDFGIVAELHKRALFEAGPGFVGTPHYMAPEQARGMRPTAATDWYAFGVLMYLALTGRQPYQGARTRVMQIKQHTDPRPPSMFTAGIPEELESLCMELLRRNPRKRPTGNEVLERLGMQARLGVGSGEFQVRVMPETLFVGRQRELATLHQVYARVCEQEAACVLVQGPSGMGKSSLVERFLWELDITDGDQPLVLSGRCHERENLPYKAFDGVIDDLTRQLMHMPPVWRRAVVSGDMLFLAQLFPALRHALGTVDEETLAMVKDLGPVQQRARAIAALRELIAVLAEQRPVVLHIEDLQWADDDSLELLCSVLQSPAPPRVLVLTTLRTDEIDGEITGQQSAVARLIDTIESIEAVVPCTTLSVGPLSESEQRELIDKMAALPQFPGAHQRLDDARYSEIMGHPMLLIELARAAPDADPDGRPGAARAALRLEDFLWDRLLCLPAEARDLMECVALVGRPVPLRVLARACSLSSMDSERAATTLRIANLARISRSDPEPWLVAYHDKVRETIGERMRRRTRMARHRRIAQALETWDRAPGTLLADQWIAAGEPARAAQYVLQAASKAFELLAFERAISLYRSVLDMVPAGSGRLHIERLRCQACVGLIQVMRVIDRHDEVLELLDEAQAMATAHALVEELATIHYLRGSQLFFLGDLAGCMEQHERASEYARRAGSPEREAQALSGLGDAYYMSGLMISAHEYYDRCIALSREHGFDDIAAANLSMRGMTRQFQNQLAAAVQDCLNAGLLARRMGSKRAALIAYGCLVWSLLDIGDMTQAQRERERFSQIVRELGARRFEINALFFASKIAALQGRPAEARELAAQSLARCRDNGMAFMGGAVLANLALVTDDLVLRQQALTEGEELLAAGAPSHNHLHFYKDAMDSALAVGDLEAVERYAQGLEDYTRSEPLPWSRFSIGRARALARHARGQGDPTELRRLHDEAHEAGLYVAARALGRALGDDEGA